MVGAETFLPLWLYLNQPRSKRGPAFEFYPMALAVIEPNSLDDFEAIQRPGKAGGAVLPAREEN